MSQVLQPHGGSSPPAGLPSQPPSGGKPSAPAWKRPTHPPVRIDTCIVGDDTTCDAAQHERCRTELGVSSCLCRPGYSRRKHRDPCHSEYWLIYISSCSNSIVRYLSVHLQIQFLYIILETVYFEVTYQQRYFLKVLSTDKVDTIFQKYLKYVFGEILGEKSIQVQNRT